MSNKALNWAYKQRVGNLSAKAVLCYLADRANTDHQAWPRVEVIAENTEVSERSVSSALTRLKELGLVTSQRRYVGTERIPGDLYTLHIEASVTAPAPPKKPRGKAAKPASEDAPAPSRVEETKAEQDAKSAGSSTVDNPSRTQNLRAGVNADFAEQDAKFAGYSSIDPSRTLIDDDQSSSTGTHSGAASEASSDPGDAILQGIDERVSVERLRTRLEESHGVRTEGINLTVAAMLVHQRSNQQKLSDPVAYLAKAIANNPQNPDWAQLDAPDPNSAHAEDCRSGDHAWSGPFNEICRYCDAMRPGWRDDRDRAEGYLDPTADHDCVWPDEPSEDPRCLICDVPQSDVAPIMQGATR